MRIGIEGLPLLFHRTGTSTYTHELVKYLRRMHRGDQVILFARNQRLAGGSYHNISYVERAANLLYKEYRLPMELAAQHIDIYHSPRDMGLPAPSRLSCPSIMTLHDIILIRLARDYYSPARARFYERRLKSRVEAASHIITVSEFSRQDILDWSGIAPDRVSVVKDGVSERFKPVIDETMLQNVRQRYDLPPRFILCVGSTEPRKNIGRAIQAFAELRRVEPGVGLVVTGVDYCRVSPQAAYGDLPMDGVIFTGYVHDVDMPALYSAAELLFFPTLYEGFGLPPLEAMACGTPVVTSNTTSLPEITGKAALLVDPTNIAELAGALQMVLGSQKLRDTLVAAGHIQVAKYSWERMATETREIYARVIAAAG
ncbi:MAG: glycosyltransferase family 4 protein [Thermoleophilia bacterium]